MCKCTPNIRTPFCGKGDCQWPKPRVPTRVYKNEEGHRCATCDLWDEHYHGYDDQGEIPGHTHSGWPNISNHPKVEMSGENELKPEWWPENPYPESVFTMTTERFIAAIPDENLRTSISGYCGRLFFDIASREIFKAYKNHLVSTPPETEMVPEPDIDTKIGLDLITKAYLYTDTGPLGHAKRWIETVLAASKRNKET